MKKPQFTVSQTKRNYVIATTDGHLLVQGRRATVSALPGIRFFYHIELDEASQGVFEVHTLTEETTGRHAFSGLSPEELHWKIVQRLSTHSREEIIERIQSTPKL